MARILEQGRRRLSFALRTRLRGLQNSLNKKRLANRRSSQDLPHLILEHRLPIYRSLRGVSPELFENKKNNLALAISEFDGILVEPGKTFSLWHLIGPPVAKRGYREGLVLKNGKPSRGVGGGLCQLANALFWLALHSDLEVVERHHHSLDLFPDDHRIVPFGTGATIVYNFKDLRFTNSTQELFQFRLSLTERELVAQLRSERQAGHRYRVRETEHAFLEKADGLHRRNAIVREKIDATGRSIEEKTLFRNLAKCSYTLQEAL